MFTKWTYQQISWILVSNEYQTKHFLYYHNKILISNTSAVSFYLDRLQLSLLARSHLVCYKLDSKDICLVSNPDQTRRSQLVCNNFNMTVRNLNKQNIYLYMYTLIYSYPNHHWLCYNFTLGQATIHVCVYTGFKLMYDDCPYLGLNICATIHNNKFLWIFFLLQKWMRWSVRIRCCWHCFLTSCKVV